MVNRGLGRLRPFYNAHHIFKTVARGGLSFSQFGEDLLISRLASIPRNCYYVDIGAAYPVKHSNTFRWYLRGGCGITVEPNPDLAQQHRRVRPRDTCLEVGVSARPGTLIYHRFEVPDYNTFDGETASRVRGKGIRELDRLEIPTIPLAEVLERHCQLRTIDVMSIDCEGLDMEVVRSSDWSRFHPRVLVIEDHEWSFERPESAISRFLMDAGYRLVSRLSYSSVFLSHEFYDY